MMMANHQRMRLFQLALVFSFVPFIPVWGIEGARREIYKSVGDVELALHVFQPKDHEPSDRRPAALFFFGGSWNGGTPEQFAPHARYLASRGMVAMVADYRTASRHKTTPFECVKDAKSAMRWLRSHADKLGIDANRIAAGGGSAGGHLAAATATINDFNEAGDDLSVTAVPNALLLFNPVYDNGPTGYGNKRVEEYWKAFSPMHNIRKGMPPAIVFLGTKDTLITVATAKDFQAKMRAVGSQSELFLYEGQAHGFFNEGKSPRHYYETVTQTDKFLVALGYLEGAPTLDPPVFACVEDTEAKAMLVSYGNRPLARFEYALDTSTPERRLETYKPFLHVYDKAGKKVITKGAGGQFTHHRGIFLGFSRTKIGENRYDLWHMKEGVQAHQRFTDVSGDAGRGGFVAEITWQDNAGKPLLREKRHLSFSIPPEGAYGLIEMKSELMAVAGDAHMGGDPEHAGAQFRPANDVVKAETRYTFHTEGIDPKKDLDLPWVGESFRLESGKPKFSVVILNHPDNPTGTKFSAYRDYGRFGAFPDFKISMEETATLRYRWIIGQGDMLDKSVIDDALKAFAGR
jgi:acetyl esterase/lipase